MHQLSVKLNDKLMPLDRGSVYEDPIDEILIENGLGFVDGGGTMLHENGEIEFIEIDVFIEVNDIDLAIKQTLIPSLEKIGAPKGSEILNLGTKEIRHFGKLEGIGYYLDGENLEPEVYKSYDINIVIDSLKTLIHFQSDYIRYWEGKKHTALYFYGQSFEQMKKKTKDYINQYPLLQNCIVKQIA